MKKYINLLFVLAFAPTSAFSATYVLTNNPGLGTNSNGITNAAGSAFNTTGGVASVGYFTLSDAQLVTTSDPAVLRGAFVAWNTTAGANGDGSVGFISAGPTASKGIFTVSAAARTVEGSSFAGKSMYTFVGNAANFQSATQFLVLKSVFTFNALDDPTLPNVTKRFTDADTSVIIGTLGAAVTTGNSDATSNPSWRTAVLVPEASTALLGALGVLGLLRRRR